MNPYVKSRMTRSGQNSTQSNNLTGMFKGIVESSIDPMGMNRIKVRVYSVHGDYKDSPTDMLPWATAMNPTRGSYNSPEIFDRVWVTFENGDKDFPVWMGFWSATPAGRGKNPHTIDKGLDVPVDNWKYDDDMYPQSMGVARSGEGNAIWFEDTTLGDDYTGSINIENSGGVYLRLKSSKPGTDYRPKDGTTEGGGWTPKVVHRNGTVVEQSSIEAGGLVGLGNKSFKIHSESRLPLTQPNTTIEHNHEGASFKIEMTTDVMHSHSSKSDGNYSSVFHKGGTAVVTATGKITDMCDYLKLPEAW